jgi:hypothetical protein
MIYKNVTASHFPPSIQLESNGHKYTAKDNYITKKIVKSKGGQ